MNALFLSTTGAIAAVYRHLPQDQGSGLLAHLQGELSFLHQLFSRVSPGLRCSPTAIACAAASQAPSSRKQQQQLTKHLRLQQRCRKPSHKKGTSDDSNPMPETADNKSTAKAKGQPYKKPSAGAIHQLAS